MSLSIDSTAPEAVNYNLVRGYYSNNFDLFFSGESVFGLLVPTPFGNQEATLFRVFGSIIVKFDEIYDFGLFKWGFGIGIAGYRYGMYKSIDLNSNSFVNNGGVDEESFSVRDYIYSQIFDDLIVITNIIKPLGYFHFGIVMNKEIFPGIDGIVGTKDDTEITSKSRLFLDTNLFGFILSSIGYNSELDKAEYVTVKIETMSILSLFIDKERYLLPDLYLGYSYINPSFKDFNFNNTINTGIVQCFYNFGNNIYIKSFIEFFISGKNESESIFRQGLIEFGIGIYMLNNNNNNFNTYFIFGLSSFSSYRLKSFGSSSTDTIGWLGGIKIDFGFDGNNMGGSLLLTISENYSEKIAYLVESYDHLIFELKLQFGF